MTHPHRGYTLTEALIVVAILSIVASLAGVALRRRSHRTQVAGLAQEIFIRAAAARASAIGTGCQALLALDPVDADGDGQVAAVRLATRAGMAPQPLSFSPASDGVSGRREARVRAIQAGTDLGGTPPPLSDTADGVVFFPDGSARLRSSGALGATLYLADPLGQSPYRIAIFGRTGFAKLLAQ